MPKNKIGLVSEDFVSRILQIYGFTIIARNLYFRFSEIDIIATRGKVLYILEVRGRQINSARYRRCYSRTINSNCKIQNFIDFRKAIKLVYAGLVGFNIYKTYLNVSKLQLYVALVYWDNNRIIRLKFVKLYELI